jgi:hypothetical protein
MWGLKMMRFLTTVILLSITSITSAANWVYVTKSDTKVFFLDATSMTHEGGISKAWVKDVIYNDTVKDGRTVGDSAISYRFYNCAEKTVGYKSGVIYIGNKVSESETASYVQYRPIIPESLEEALYEAACNGVVPPSPFS